MLVPRYKIPLQSLLPLINPLDGFLVDGYMRCAITKEEVMQQIKNGAFEEEPWTVMKRRHYMSQADRALHARRIAFFVNNGVPANDLFPIEIRAGFKASDNSREDGSQLQPYARVLKGKHRVAAAFLRNDDSIEAVFDPINCDLRETPFADAIPIPQSRLGFGLISKRIRGWGLS